jgi:hypothetical protein
MNAEDLFGKVPAALEAWVRFAGRKTAKPAWAIDATVDAIGHWHREVLGAVGDPSVPGPARQLLRSARQAGVDLGDSEQLAALLEDWNQRPLEQ